ncbi:hypothetical protein PUNSTDRAFT_137203 [Punctularia strigosozonata HHB-11173 SS5]|uniref:uncharacterized protein n=1 Tax=Punctularia strigosozonata (strain HHB-11173) TaxID=741275 RepID=UPI000441658B|nr:uncharacterized protein PUNSTDRAFT_137203 [Punctularia strigosozonata HHB-11173 SS5]EIN05711.1 hypothetical protein PUNSTDRAFT_137203 [Punctularia strigosozonata HHB-11173 SS5]
MKDAFWDLLPLVLANLHDEYHSLCMCSRVSKAFSANAACMLYSRVVFSPAPAGVTLSLRRDKDEFTRSSVFNSARLPKNASYVRTLEISGNLQTRPPPFYELERVLSDAFPLFVNLEEVFFLPSAFHVDVFCGALVTLPNMRNLRRLSVNSSCTKETYVASLVKITGLHYLTIQDPSRAVLQELPEWLRSMQGTLTELHLTGNCGSVTPGVLRMILPHIRLITSFSLGVSFSLASSDVFATLGGLKELVSVQLHYYLQLRLPDGALQLPQLKTLIVQHVALSDQSNFDKLDEYITRLVSSTVSLKTLSISYDHDYMDYETCDEPHHDVLVEYLAENHTSLQHLHICSGSFDFYDPLAKDMLERCEALESLAVWVDFRDLDMFPSMLEPLRYLRELRIKVVPDADLSDDDERPYSEETIALGIARGVPQIHCLQVNTNHWHANRTISTEVELESVEKRVLPWRRQ